MLVICDGSDKTGKDTIIQELHYQTNYEHVIINRCIASNWVMGQIHNRNLDFDEYLEYDEALSKLPFVRQVILFANKDDLIERFKKHNETDISIDEIDKVQNLFIDYAKKTKIKTILINTSEYDLLHTVKLIKEFICH
jgi:thymidylate kinase